MTVFTIILNYKTYKDLHKCLVSLQSSKLPKGYSQKIVVIDSEYNSKDHESLKNKHKNVEFIPKKNNLGVGGGYNIGFKKALSQNPGYILMVTPDITVRKNTIEKLLNAMDANTRLGVVAPKMLLNKNSKKIYFIKGKLDNRTKSGGHIDYLKTDNGQYDEQQLIESDFVNCSIVLIKPHALRKAGYWDEKYFLYYEDVDWCIRVKNAGYKVGVAPSATAYHDESSSVKKGSEMQEYYTTRNLLYFVKKNFNQLQQLISYLYFLKEVLILTKDSLNSTGKRKKLSIKLVAAFHFLTNKMGKQYI